MIQWKRIRWGTLTRWLKKHRRSIKTRYGKDPFTKNGKINNTVLRKLYRDEQFLKKLAGSKWRRIKRKIHFKLHILNR